MTPGASPDHGDSPGASARPPPPRCSRRYCPAYCRGRCCVSPEMDDSHSHWTMLVTWHEYCVNIGQEGNMIIFRKFASNHQSRNILRKFVAVQLCDIYKLSFYWLIEKMLSTLICFIIKRWNSFLVLLEFKIGTLKLTCSSVWGRGRILQYIFVHFLTALPDTAYLILRTQPEGSDRLVAPEIKSR